MAASIHSLSAFRARALYERASALLTRSARLLAEYRALASKLNAHPAE